MPWATEPYNHATSETFCRIAAGNFLLRKQLHFLMFDREHYIVNIGMHVIDWTVPKYEIGHWLGTPFVGRGYMIEALAAVTNFTFEAMRAVRVEVRTDAENVRSRRVAERCGYALEGTLRQYRLAPSGVPYDGCV